MILYVSDTGFISSYLIFPKTVNIFLHFVMCGIDVRRRICLVTIQKAKNEELVGDKSTHEIFAEYKERVIQRRLDPRPPSFA